MQIDEPALALDLTPEVCDALRSAYQRLGAVSEQIRICLATYFGGLRDNLSARPGLPVAAVHLDLVRAPEQLNVALPQVGRRHAALAGRDRRPQHLAGRLGTGPGLVETAAEQVGADRLMVGPSCSLLHCPIDLDLEDALDGELKGWLAFAKQKLGEIRLLGRAIDEGRAAVADALAASREARERRGRSSRIHNSEVGRLAGVGETMLRRTGPSTSAAAQREKLACRSPPTTTIGSFPQTAEVRKARAALKKGDWTAAQYEAFCRDEIARTVRFQEEVGLDVLVHGECERNDMVEYFGEQLEGFAFTRGGWVQSYGTRCVKPPIIYGDVRRVRPMTVRWIEYAQSLTRGP